MAKRSCDGTHASGAPASFCAGCTCPLSAEGYNRPAPATGQSRGGQCLGGKAWGQSRQMGERNVGQLHAHPAGSAPHAAQSCKPWCYPTRPDRAHGGDQPCRDHTQPRHRAININHHQPPRTFPHVTTNCRRARTARRPARRHQHVQLPAGHRTQRVRRSGRRVPRHGRRDRRAARRADQIRAVSETRGTGRCRGQRHVGHRSDRCGAGTGREDQLHRSLRGDRGNLPGARRLAHHLDRRGRSAGRAHRRLRAQRL